MSGAQRATGEGIAVFAESALLLARHVLHEGVPLIGAPRHLLPSRGEGTLLELGTAP